VAAGIKRIPRRRRMKRASLATWMLLVLLVCGCAGRTRLPECRGPLTPINPAGEDRAHD
jgi:hypothetical protein